MPWILLASALAIAYANGSNDNFKGVATLFGSKTASYRGALVWATLTTGAGSVTALLLAGGLVARFGGRGLVPDAIVGDPTLLAAVGGAAAVTVLLASAIGAPISTTHALLGALLGAGFLASGGNVQPAVLGSAFVLPLLASPLLAACLVGLMYMVPGAKRLGAQLSPGVCICAAEARPAFAGSERRAAEGLWMTSPVIASSRECAIHGLKPAVVVPPALDLAHYMSAGAVGFARGVNDTPKIVALLLPLQAVSVPWHVPAVAAAMAAGGLLGARRVAQTMSHRITCMTPGQGLLANVATAGLVLTASRFGMPVSTTHVSSGSLFGLGLVNRGARWAVIGRIALAWVATIPFAAFCGGLLWLALANVPVAMAPR